jgi:hypothetical protein
LRPSREGLPGKPGVHPLNHGCDEEASKTTTLPPATTGPGVTAGEQYHAAAAWLLSARSPIAAVSRPGGPDLIGHLCGTSYPLVTGLVAAGGGREIFVTVS